MVQTLETPVQELSLEDARREVYALNDLKGRISELIDVRWNHGPFVLAHSDLRPPNIIVDEHLNIQAIVDWEWAGTIPRQFFMPPTWLVGELPCYVASTDYSREYAEFYAVFAAKGTPCCRQLADEWGARLTARSGVSPGRLAATPFPVRFDVLSSHLSQVLQDTFGRDCIPVLRAAGRR